MIYLRVIKFLDLELWIVVNDLIKVERTVLKHVGGALRWKVNEISQSMSNAPTLRVAKPDEDIKRKLTSAEDRVKELEAHVEVLKSTVSRLDSSQDHSQGQTRQVDENTTSPNMLAFNRMKLD